MPDPPNDLESGVSSEYLSVESRNINILIQSVEELQSQDQLPELNRTDEQPSGVWQEHQLHTLQAPGNSSL